MDILNKPIKTFSFDYIASFCAQGYVEGPQIDYKREIPVKGLAKHFAAFSNTRGGVIIVGVEEDKSTGVPKVWNGIKNEGKLVEKIHQFAANVEPLPLYEVHITDEKDGNVFLIVRIFEGDTTPYYVQNDANLWVRTGSISNPIDIASVDAIELLFGKREKAKLAREIYIKKAQDVYQAALTRAEEERKRMIVGQTGELKYYQKILGADVTPCTVVVQPFYPAKALTTPQEIRSFLEEINDRNRWRDKFPSMKMEPIPDGLLGFEWGYYDGSIECSQIYANGLVYNLLDVLNVSSEGKIIWISAILQNLFMVLKIAGDFYRLVGYQGELTAILSLKNTRGALLKRLAPSRWILYNRDKQSLLPDYSWNFELDTALLNHDKNFQDFYISMIRSIYWSLGYEPAKEEVYKAYLKECGWLVEG